MAVSGACPSHYYVTSLISDALGDQRRYVNMGSGDAYDIVGNSWQWSWRYLLIFLKSCRHLNA